MNRPTKPSGCTGSRTGVSSPESVPGLAAYAGIDATLVRLGFALLPVFGSLGVLIYLCAWIVIPDETDGVSIAEPFAGRTRP